MLLAAKSVGKSKLRRRGHFLVVPLPGSPSTDTIQTAGSLAKPVSAHVSAKAQSKDGLCYLGQVDTGVGLASKFDYALLVSAGIRACVSTGYL